MAWRWKVKRSGNVFGIFLHQHGIFLHSFLYQLTVIIIIFAAKVLISLSIQDQNYNSMSCFIFLWFSVSILVDTYFPLFKAINKIANWIIVKILRWYPYQCVISEHYLTLTLYTVQQVYKEQNFITVGEILWNIKLYSSRNPVTCEGWDNRAWKRDEDAVMMSVPRNKQRLGAVS